MTIVSIYRKINIQINKDPYICLYMMCADIKLSAISLTCY